MSKVESEKINQKDIYSVWKEDLENYYSSLEKSMTQFHQSSVNLFQEYVKSWNNIALSFVEIQREFATKVGLKTNLPENALKIMHDTTEKLNRTLGVQQKIAVESIDATKHNIKIWNENSKPFVDINKSMINSVLSSINPRA